MSSVTATPRRVEQLETKSVKVFYWLLISDRAASWDFKLTDDRNFKLGIHFFMKVRGHNFSSREITAHLVRSKQTTCSALQEVAKCHSCGASEEKISTVCSLLWRRDRSSSAEIKITTCSASREVPNFHSCGASKEKISTVCSLSWSEYPQDTHTAFWLEVWFTHQHCVHFVGWRESQSSRRESSGLGEGDWWPRG